MSFVVSHMAVSLPASNILKQMSSVIQGGWQSSHIDPGHFDGQLGRPEPYISRYQLHLYHLTAGKVQKGVVVSFQYPGKNQSPCFFLILSAFAVPKQAA